jgi:hypothetical protein
MSQKSTVTGLCSPSGGSGAASPRRGRRFSAVGAEAWPASAGSPQAHRRPSAAPHSAQNRDATTTSAPQPGGAHGPHGSHGPTVRQRGRAALLLALRSAARLSSGRSGAAWSGSRQGSGSEEVALTVEVETVLVTGATGNTGSVVWVFCNRAASPCARGPQGGGHQSGWPRRRRRRATEGAVKPGVKLAAGCRSNQVQRRFRAWPRPKRLGR